MATRRVSITRVDGVTQAYYVNDDADPSHRPDAIGHSGTFIPAEAVEARVQLLREQLGPPSPQDLIEPWLGPYAHPLVHHFNTVMSEQGFDGDQQNAVVWQHLTEMNKMLDSSKSSYAADIRDRLAMPVTDDEYQQWLDREVERERLTVEQAAQHRQLGAPSRMEMEMLRTLPGRVDTALKAYQREIRYAAGWRGVRVDDMAQRVSALREQLAINPPSAAEAAHAKAAFAGLYKYRDVRKSPPLDTRTAVALHRALTNPDEPALQSLSPSGAQYVVVDTETNGLQHDSDILTLSMRVYNADGSADETRSFTFRPTKTHPDGSPFTGEDKAVDIHGITPDMVADAAPFADHAEEVATVLQGRTLVAHNLYFDYAKIQRHLAMSGSAPLGSPAMVDTLRMARLLDPDSPNHKLGTLADRYGVNDDPGSAHNADYDTLLAAKVFFRLRARLGQ